MKRKQIGGEALVTGDEAKLIISHSPAETESIGSALAATLSPGEVVAFTGSLGMGKTAFVRGMAAGLHCSEDVTSPTFTLINEYRGGRLSLCHLDAYRLNSGEELFETGFFDYLDSGWVAAVEWSEIVQAVLDPAVRVGIKRIDDNTRQITIDRRKP